ncbi:MAG: MlaD family protein [Verrucomicrobiota bacterium]
MKKNNLANYIIAGVVIACSLVLLAALTHALTKTRLTRPGKTVLVDFPSVIGIKVHSSVRYSGAPVGYVSDIYPLTLEERQARLDDGDPSNDRAAIRVVLTLEEDCPPLTLGTRAEMAADTVLAEKFINLNPGPPDEKVLPNDIVLAGTPAASFEELTSAGMDTMAAVNKILTDLNEKHPDLPDYIAQLVKDGQATLEQAKELTVRLNLFMEDNGDRLTTSLAELDELMTDMNVVSKNLKVITTNAKALTSTLQQKPWRVFWGGDTVDAPSEDEILKSDKPLPTPGTISSRAKKSSDKEELP